jgi:hypothetical protein
MAAPPPSPSALKQRHGHDQHTSVDARVNVAGDGVIVQHCAVEVVMRDMTRRLRALILQHVGRRPRDGPSPFICCAIAWLTNTDILAALVQAKQRGAVVAVVVQKEDFLRPERMDVNRRVFARRLRRQYDALGKLDIIADVPSCYGVALLAHAQPFLGGEARLGAGITFDRDSGADGEDVVAAVRCVGNHNSAGNPSFPRMHNKFLVLGHFADNDEDESCTAVPDLVWTGSFNASAAAEASFENAVIIRSRQVATTYLAEWALLFCLSEPLDWTSEWIAPSFNYQT